MTADGGQFPGGRGLGGDPPGADEPGEQPVRLGGPQHVEPVHRAAVRGDDRGQGAPAGHDDRGVSRRGKQRGHLPGAGRVVQDDQLPVGAGIRAGVRSGFGQQPGRLLDGQRCSVGPGQREYEHPAGEGVLCLVGRLTGQRRLSDARCARDDDQPRPVGAGEPLGDGSSVALAPGEGGDGRYLPPRPAAVGGRAARRQCGDRGPGQRPGGRRPGHRRGGRQVLGAQDGELQTAQSRARVDAQLVAEPVAYGAVLGERLGLPSGAVEGLDELLGEPFAHRVAAGALVEVDQDLMAVAGGEFQIADPLQDP
ncbi:hypothetical protein GCM10020254_74150 [Streptomyces goshikiensis]